jgi:hypothetical protein
MVFIQVTSIESALRFWESRTISVSLTRSKLTDGFLCLEELEINTCINGLADDRKSGQRK